MSQIDDTRTVIYEIDRLLGRNTTITGWKTYVQDISRMRIRRENINRSDMKVRQDEIYQAGVHLVVEREGQWIEEYIFGISSLRNLKDLLENPIMKYPIETKIERFQMDRKLKTTIKGDGYFLDSTNIEDLLDMISVRHDSMREIRFSDTVSRDQEAIAISNHYGDENIAASIRYTATISGLVSKQNTYSLKELIGSRNLPSFIESYEISKAEMVQQLVYIRNSVTKFLKEKIDLLISPEVTGEIIRVLARYFNPSNFVELFPPEYQIYDNPQRPSGFFSSVIDDDGNTTTTTNLLEKKNLNLFKFKPFEQFIHSYRFKKRKSISNVILSGGIGSGESFTERRVSFVRVANANTSVIGSGSNLQAIINVHEADLWKNGILSNPVSRFTIIVNLSDFFSKGTYSNDQVLTFAIEKLGASYTGWMWLPSETYKLY